MSSGSSGARAGLDFGLALGGGSFRGLAHVGVLEVLEREGLRPSWLAGTSAGAIAAALVAFGVAPSKMREAVDSVSWGTIARLRPRAPIGTLTNEGIGEALLEMLGDQRIEAARVPLRIVATDITTGDRILLDRGPLIPAVRASSCIPGVFAPVEIDGRLLVDGALVENVPAQAARELREGPVVGVSLGLDLPFTRPRNTLQVLVNAFEIAVSAQSRRALRSADLVLEPELHGFNRLRTTHVEDIVAAGRRCAEQALPRLREVLSSVA